MGWRQGEAEGPTPASAVALHGLAAGNSRERWAMVVLTIPSRRASHPRLRRAPHPPGAPSAEGVRRTGIAGVADAVAVSVVLVLVRDRRAVVARVAPRVGVAVELIRVRRR